MTTKKSATKSVALKQVAVKTAPVPEFVVRQYGVHTPEVVTKALNLAGMIDQHRAEIDLVKNAINSVNCYPKFVGIMMKAWAADKSAKAAIQAFFISCKPVGGSDASPQE